MKSIKRKLASARSMLAAVAAGIALTALTLPARAQTCAPESGFSPEGGAAALVLRAIGSARGSIRLAAYSFTSPDVVRGLIAAKRRGVDVAVVVDAKSNLREDRSGKGVAALNLLREAGIAARTIETYSIHHDKYMVIDGETVETGSFNYTKAATHYNSENVLVLWNCKSMAEQYLNHWNSRWEQGKDWENNAAWKPGGRKGR